MACTIWKYGESAKLVHIAVRVVAVVLCGVGRCDVDRQRMSLQEVVCVGVHRVDTVLVTVAQGVHVWLNMVAVALDVEGERVSIVVWIGAVALRHLSCVSSSDELKSTLSSK